MIKLNPKKTTEVDFSPSIKVLSLYCLLCYEGRSLDFVNLIKNCLIIKLCRALFSSIISKQAIIIRKRFSTFKTFETLVSLPIQDFNDNLVFSKYRYLFGHLNNSEYSLENFVNKRR